MCKHACIMHSLICFLCMLHACLDLCYSQTLMGAHCKCSYIGTRMSIGVTLLWLNDGFLISDSINICVHSTHLAVEAACCF